MIDGLGARANARIGLLQVCAAGVLWGTGGLVVTVLHERDGLGAMTASAWRMLVAAAAALGFAAVTGRSRVVLGTVRSHPVLAVLIGCGTAAYQALYFASVLTVGVSVATVVSLGLAPVLAGTWEHLHARTRPTAREGLVLTAALGGLVLISATAQHGSASRPTQPALGLTLAVAVGATYAATTVLGHRLAQRVDPVALTTCTTAVGALALAPFLGVAVAAGWPVFPRKPHLARAAGLPRRRDDGPVLRAALRRAAHHPGLGRHHRHPGRTALRCGARRRPARRAAPLVGVLGPPSSSAPSWR